MSEKEPSGGEADDLDALLASLGGGEAAPAGEEKPSEGDADLDALLAELGGDKPAEDAGSAPPAQADADLDALLAELGGGEPAAATSDTQAGLPAPAEAAEVEVAEEAPAKPSRSAVQAPTVKPFDAPDEEPGKGPRWDRFAVKDPGAKRPEVARRAKPWRQAEGTQAPGEGADEPRAGWSKLKRPDAGSKSDSDGGDSSGPSAGWSKLGR